LLAALYPWAEKKDLALPTAIALPHFFRRAVSEVGNKKL
jgi:hypothetical protein